MNAGEDEAQSVLIGLFLETRHYLISVGQSIHIPILLTNSGEREVEVDVSFRGIPAGWGSLPASSLRLAAGEKQTVQLTVRAPQSLRAIGGSYTIVIQAAEKGSSRRPAEAEIHLKMGERVVEGRIVVLVEKTQCHVSPGEALQFFMVLLNSGSSEDSLSLNVEGLPSGWVSFSASQLNLAPGGQQQVVITIRPPRMPQSRAGRHPFTLVVSSRNTPDQPIRISCNLTIASFTQFRCLINPPRVVAGESARLLINNQGNIPQVYSITWESHDEKLAIDPGRFKEQRVLPGEVAAVEFSPKPHQRPLFGYQAIYPYRIQVRASDGSTQVMNGFVTSQPLVPFWVLPLTLLLCLLISGLPLFFIYLNNLPATPRTPPASLTQTAGITQTASANQTRAAIIGQQDADGDGLNNQQEVELGTNPMSPDSDGDGLTDGAEMLRYASDPLKADTDGDGLPDGEEVRLGISPAIADSDMDGMTDGEELRRGSDPRNPDTDGDSLIDGDEVKRGLDPRKVDTDGDGLSDGDEITRGTDPLRQDSDSDRLSDGDEVRLGANPLNPDSDGDGILDGLDPDPLSAINPSLTATAISAVPTTTQTQSPTRTPTRVATPAPTSSPTLLAPSGALLFESNRDGNPEIYLLNLGTPGVSRLTHNAAVDTQPAWSPDRSRIAFTSNRDGNFEIYVMNADGSESKNLSNNPAEDQDPTWSPDGEWIAFTSNRSGNRDIYVMRRDGSALRNLTNSPANEYQPCWFVEQLFFTTVQRILFTTDRDGNQEIYIMSIDGFNQTNLSENPANDSFAAASRFGDRILFVSDRSGNQDIFVMSVTGSEQTNLSNDPAQDTYPVWSPDNRWIAFTSDRGGNQEIFLINADGSNPTNYTRNPAADAHPAWR